MKLEEIWEKHRTFILRVSGMAAGFLILLWIASHYADVSAESEKNLKLARKLQKRANTLELEFDRAISKSRSVGSQLDELLAKVELSAQGSAVEMLGSTSEKAVHFRKQKEKIYRQFRRKADRIGLGYPEMKEINFEDTMHDERLQDSYFSLIVLEKVFAAAVDQNVMSIDSVDPRAIELEDIKGNKERVMVRYPVTVELVARYEACLGLLETFQRDQNYLSVELEELAPDEEIAGVLRARINFVGIDQIDRPKEITGRGRGGRRRR